MAAGLTGKQVAIVDLQRGTVGARLAPPRNSLFNLRFSPDGRELAAVDGQYSETADPNKTLVVEQKDLTRKVVGSTGQTIIYCQVQLLAGQDVLFSRSFNMQPARYGVVSSTNPAGLRAGLLSVVRAEMSRMHLPMLVQPGLTVPVRTTMPGARP
jgi:hypothetical protein